LDVEGTLDACDWRHLNASLESRFESGCPSGTRAARHDIARPSANALAMPPESAPAFFWRLVDEPADLGASFTRGAISAFRSAAFQPRTRMFVVDRPVRVDELVPGRPNRDVAGFRRADRGTTCRRSDLPFGDLFRPAISQRRSSAAARDDEKTMTRRRRSRGRGRGTAPFRRR